MDRALLAVAMERLRRPLSSQEDRQAAVSYERVFFSVRRVPSRSVTYKVLPFSMVILLTFYQFIFIIPPSW